MGGLIRRRRRWRRRCRAGSRSAAPTPDRTHTNADTECVGYTEMLTSSVPNMHGSVSNENKWAVWYAGAGAGIGGAARVRGAVLGRHPARPVPGLFTLVTGPIRSLSLKLSDTRVYEPQIRALWCSADQPCPVRGCCPGSRSGARSASSSSSTRCVSDPQSCPFTIRVGLVVSFYNTCRVSRVLLQYV